MENQAGWHGKAPNKEEWERARKELVEELDTVPDQAVFHFPGGLSDFLKETIGTKTTVTPEVFSGRTKQESGHGRVEWAVSWTPEGFGDYALPTVMKKVVRVGIGFSPKP